MLSELLMMNIMDREISMLFVFFLSDEIIEL